MSEEPDTVWITVPEPVREDEWERITAQLRETFPEHKVVVTTDGFETIGADQAREIAAQLADVLDR